MRQKIFAGNRFAYLTVIEYDKNAKYASWRCKCFCGKEITVRSSNLLSFKTQSCGCMSSAIRNDSFYNNKAEIKQYLNEIKHFVEQTICTCNSASRCERCVIAKKTDIIKSWIYKRWKF